MPHGGIRCAHDHPRWLGELTTYNDTRAADRERMHGLVVFSAGLGARALASPWAGFLAADAVPMINPWAEASRWATRAPC